MNAIVRKQKLFKKCHQNYPIFNSNKSTKNLKSQKWIDVNTLKPNEFQTFKFIFGIFCSGILVYQSSQLISGYLRFETIVMIENNIIKSELEYPSFSICDRYPKIEDNHGEEPSAFRLPIPITILMMEKGIAHIDNGVLKMATFNKGDNIYGNRVRPPVSKGFYQFNEDSILSMDGQPPKTHISSFHSIGRISQCRTYFSQIDGSGRVVNKMMRPIEPQIEQIHNNIAYFAINFSEHNLPKEPLIDKDVFVVVHETTQYPPENGLIYASRRFLVKENHSYDLSYSKRTIVGLPNPYKTDCYEYGSNLNTTDIYGLSRGMCVDRCVYEKVLNKYKCLKVGSKVIYGVKYFDNSFCSGDIHRDYSNTSIYYFEWRAYHYCSTLCKSNCVQELYEYELQEVDETEISIRFRKSRNGSDMSFITLFAKHMEQIHYHHSPKMLLTDFLCSLGGLFSLWLGLSVLSIFDYLVAVYSVIKYKIKSHFN